jgi:hypothetical protein
MMFWLSSQKENELSENRRCEFWEGIERKILEWSKSNIVGKIS